MRSGSSHDAPSDAANLRPLHTAALSPAEEVLEYTDEMVEAVCAAWSEPGQHVAHHLQLRRWVQTEWPALADALTALTKGTR